MRTAVVFLSLILVGCTSKEPANFRVFWKEPPSVSVFTSGVESFQIDSSGRASWDYWVGGVPPEGTLPYECPEAVYLEVLNLAYASLSSNFFPAREFVHTSSSQIYTIRFGEYFSSLALNIIVYEGEKMPNELQQLLAYISELKRISDEVGNQGSERACFATEQFHAGDPVSSASRFQPVA